jgi:hypothetical protein
MACLPSQTGGGLLSVTHLMTKGNYDALDLHFYGCVKDIPSKIATIKKLLPETRKFLWISTENGGPDYRCPDTPQTEKLDPSQFEQAQAAQVPARLSACAEGGGSVCLWFALFDLKKSAEPFTYLGLLDQDSNPPRRKAAYNSFRTFVANHK